MCSHTLDGNPALVCDRQDPHDETAEGGHVYTNTTGSELDAEPTRVR